MLLAGSCTLATAQQVAARGEQTAHKIQRDKWQMAGRRIPGTSSAILRGRAIQQKIQMRAMRPVSQVATVAGGAWVSLGPSPLPSDASGIGLQDYNWVSGRATAIAIDPNDLSGNTVYAGGAYGGVWKSTNGGSSSQNPASVTWSALTDGQSTLAVGAIAIQPQLSNPNPSRSVVLAGTGETDSSGDSYYGLGILRSADAGQTWTLITQDVTGIHSFAGLGFSHIAFSTASPNQVVAAAASASEGILEGLENPLTANRGLYHSTDAGLSWSRANISDAGVTIAPASVTSVVYNSAAGLFYAAVRFHGIYSSPDGSNWARLSLQPGVGLNAAVCPAQAVLPSGCPIYRGEIAVVTSPPTQPTRDEMYVWYVDANNADQGIWKSVNGGGSWNQLNDSGITNCGDFFGGCGTAQGSYNLALAAVPNGSATDLYAGATNLYKCTITNAAPLCNSSGNQTFLNLTHVYGCSDIARVHPDQHGIYFLLANGAALLYFANDGGIYRALDGFTGLTTGTCGLSNQFDSLNETLGPMTQFVSISESATDPNLVFGGTQDNGAPATAVAQSNGSWVNVNAGDAGFTAVNPANDQEWFLAAPPDSASGVNLFRCANGIDCHTLDFQSDQIADSNSLGGDAGAFDLPFTLDPQNSAALILGTCHIWRGSSNGGGFSLLSPDFETGGSGACSGNEINLVRSLAAGGVADSNGLSQVIYAGTNGEGPLISTTPPGGHVWVTTHADLGPLTWTDVTGNINPQGFPISSIALDSADPLGKTAYVDIMGFHAAHVWKTTNAGTSWTDFSANLPDAPVNSVLVDSGASLSNGTVYIGTDVGVFASSTGAPNWTEVAPGLGQRGFLPNVAVTSLQIFNSGGLKRLRAATYGRGIWEWNLVPTPDFQLSVMGNLLPVLAGQTITLNGTAYALNGYSGRIIFSCTPANTSPPQNCNVVPASIVSSVSGTPFTVNVSGSGGDYLFNVHAVGTDSASVTHDVALTLHIVDFNLGAPSPASVSVVPGNTSAPVSLVVSALSSFTGTVTLSCSGLLSGASCQFQPSSSASPTRGSPISLALSVVTTSSTPLGTSQISISASSPGEPVKTQTLNLTVGASPDYSLNIANPSLTAAVNSAAIFNGSLTAANGYSSAVALSCGVGAPPSCVVSPTSAAPSGSGAPFTVTVSSSVSQAYSFNITGVGSDPAAIAHSAAVNFAAMPSKSFDYTIGATPSSASVAAGQSSLFSLDVSPTTGAFPNNVNFSCSGLPALTTCGFNPSQLSSGSGASIVTMTLLTTAPVSRISKVALAGSFGFFPAFSSVVLLCFSRERRRTYMKIGGAVIALLLILLCLSCGCGLQGDSAGGGGGNPGTPAGTYNIKVMASSDSVTHSTQVVLTVTP